MKGERGRLQGVEASAREGGFRKFQVQSPEIQVFTSTVNRKWISTPLYTHGGTRDYDSISNSTCSGESISCAVAI